MEKEDFWKNYECEGQMHMSDFIPFSYPPKTSMVFEHRKLDVQSHSSMKKETKEEKGIL